MEYLSEQSRYEDGCLGRDFELAIVVAAMQRLFNLEEAEDV